MNVFFSNKKFKHHHTDVIAGAVIGISVAFFITCISGKQIWNFNRLRHETKRKEVELKQAVEWNDLDI